MRRRRNKSLYQKWGNFLNTRREKGTRPAHIDIFTKTLSIWFVCSFPGCLILALGVKSTIRRHVHLEMRWRTPYLWMEEGTVSSSLAHDLHLIEPSETWNDTVAIQAGTSKVKYWCRMFGWIFWRLMIVKRPYQEGMTLDRVLHCSKILILLSRVIQQLCLCRVSDVAQSQATIDLQKIIVVISTHWLWNNDCYLFQDSACVSMWWKCQR